MSNDVTLTASMRKNLLNLQQTQKLFDTTQQRLSTGKKVNSALDNPSSYFSAQSLTSRADGLSSLLDSMGQAVQTLTAADNSITSLQSLVEQAKALANTARDTANVASYKKGTVDLTAVGAPTELGGVAANDEFSIRLGDGDTIKGTKNVTLTQTLKDVGFAGSAGTSLSIKIGDNNAVNINVLSADTLEAVAKKINENTRLKGLVNAGIEDGKFVIKSTDAKNAVTIRAVSADGKHFASNAAGNVASALGLDEGYTVKIKTAGAAVITGESMALAGGTAAPGTTTLGQLGISPTPATIKVSVGENVNTLELKADDKISDVVSKLSAVNGITANYSGSTLVVTGDAGKAIKIEDVSGNAASTFGIATADYIKPTSGGIDELVNTINGLNTDIKAEIDKDGNLKISATNGEQLTITDVANSTGKVGKAASSLGVAGLADNGSNERKSYAEQFDTILNQIDQLVTNGDTGYKGVNLLNGDDLTVNFNEDRTSSLLIKGATFDTKGLGLNTSKNEWRNASDIDAALANVDTANSRLKTKSSELGQNLSVIQTRQDFTENMINTLTTGADDLTLADMNEESANLLALQTRQQLATNALSLASQSQQSVLSLF